MLSSDRLKQAKICYTTLKFQFCFFFFGCSCCCSSFDSLWLSSPMGKYNCAICAMAYTAVSCIARVECKRTLCYMLQILVNLKCQINRLILFNVNIALKNEQNGKKKDTKSSNQLFAKIYWAFSALLFKITSFIMLRLMCIHSFEYVFLHPKRVKSH